MKLNYRKPDGTRTTITLPDALVDTWAAAKPHLKTPDELAEALRAAIEATPAPKAGSTVQATVEAFLLGDIRDRLTALEVRARG